jgi:hypothetical protein
LVDVRLAKNGMQSRDHGHVQVLQQFKNMAACIPPENPILVLQTHQVHMTRIQKIGGCSIGGDVALIDLASHPCRVGVRRLPVVDGDHRRSVASVLVSHGIAQICREGGNSTLPGQMVPNHRHSSGKRPAAHQLQRGCRLFAECRRPHCAPHQGVRLRIQ